MSKRVDALLGARLPMLKRKNLHLSGEEVTDTELAAILLDTRVPPLRILDIGDNHLTAAAINHIISSTKTADLAWLVLSNNAIGDAGLQALAGSDRLRQVSFLGLVAVDASSDGVSALTRASLPALRTLQLGWQPLGNNNTDSAHALTGLADLDKLDLMHAQLSADSVRLLLQESPAAHVSLSENPIGAGGLVALTHLSPRLRTIELNHTGLNADDMAALAKLTVELENLDVSHCELGDSGLTHLARAPWLERLQTLDASSAGATAAGRTALRTAWGSRPGLTLEPDNE